MRCELCGKYIQKGKKIKVEGSVVVTCDNCSSYGEFVKNVEPYKVKIPLVPRITENKKETQEERFEIILENEMIENFSDIIRKERINRGMKQEELGKKLNEPVSLVRRIESGKFEPSPTLGRKIEKTLGVKLFKKHEKIDFQEGKMPQGGELTLGDMITIKKKQTEEKGK